jgi:ribosome biogenesis protein UTP30
MAATKRSSSIKVISPKGASLSKGAVSKGSSVSKGAAPKATSSTKAAPALNRPLIEKAVSSLLKHHAAQQDANNASTALLDVGASANVSLQFGLAKILQSHGGGGGSKGKPISIPLKHPMYNVHQGEDGEDDTAMNTTDDNSLENVDICLIVKGTSKADIQAMVDRFPSHLGCIKKILTLESLRQKFKEYKHKRELHSRYDLFVVDDRVLPMLGRQLGHKFFKAGNKQGCPPIPINVTRTEAFPFAIQKILKSTYLTIPAGTCVGVR